MTIGTKDDPWKLTTPPGSAAYEMYRDQTTHPHQLVCQVGSTKLVYLWRAVDDLHAWLIAQGDRVLLGAADENKEAAPGTVEAFGRAPDNPVGGWYGLRKGYRTKLECADENARLISLRPRRRLRPIASHADRQTCRRSMDWPVIAAMRSKSLSTCNTVSRAISAVAAISRSGIDGARCWPRSASSI